MYKNNIVNNNIVGFFNRNAKEVKLNNIALESIFSNEDRLYKDDFSTQIDADKISGIRHIIENKLPDFEKHVIIFCFYYNKSEALISRLLHISQPMVHYFKKRGLQRINFLLFLDSIDVEEMELFLKQHVSKKQCIAMLEYFKVHDLRKILVHISETEKRRKLSYCAIGSRIKYGVNKINLLRKSSSYSTASKANMYYNVFSLLKKHHSIRSTQSKKVLQEIG